MKHLCMRKAQLLALMPHCAVFHVPSAQHLAHNSAGQHILAVPPDRQTKYWLKHYNRCKATNPYQTSATYAVPVWHSRLVKRLCPTMAFVTVYDKGTTVGSCTMPYTLHVYHDSAQQPCLRAIQPDNALLFRCRIGHHKATAMIDTGASHTIVDAKYLRGVSPEHPS